MPDVSYSVDAEGEPTLASVMIRTDRSVASTREVALPSDSDDEDS